MKETLCENSMNFVKHIPMIYANFIIIVITVFGEKRRKPYFRIAPLIEVKQYILLGFDTASLDNRFSTIRKKIMCSFGWCPRRMRYFSSLLS